MVKRLVILLIICAMISPVLLTSCQKDLYDPSVTVVSKEATDLDFSTTQKVKFNLTFDVPTGYVAEFDLYTENPCETSDWVTTLKEGVNPIGSCVSVSGKFTGSKVFPGYVDELYAYSSNLFAPRLLHAKISNGTATFEAVSDNSAQAKSAITRSVANNKYDLYLGQTDAKGRPTYIDESKKVDISQDMLTKINDAFPNGINGKLTVPANSPYLQDATLYIEKEAEVWVTILVSDGDFQNGFGYFCYDGPASDLATMNDTQKAELQIICAFEQAKVKDVKNPSKTLLVGEYVKLKYYNKATGNLEDKFPAGTTLGWALRPYHPSNSAANSQINGTYLYSCSAWNPEPDQTLKQHNIYFNAGTSSAPFICFGFEDMRNDAVWGGYRDRDCNDMMFNVQLNPIDALDPPPTIDEEPEDVYATQKYVGYLGFEDYWPQYFDYDLNDLLVKYQSTVNTKTQTGKNADTKTYITTIEDQYTMVFTGADFDNQFSVSMPFSRDLVEKVAITDELNNTKTVLGSALEKDWNGFVLDVCISPQAVLTAYDRKTPPQIYKVVVTLKDKALTMTDFENNSWMAPYNPFITPYYAKKGRDGKFEVHLPGYMPTQRVIDYSTQYWFGKFDDRSNVEEGIYYLGGDKVYDMNGEFIEQNIFPFAIHLSGVENFYIPDERVRIDKTFPRYRKWAESGMTDDKDWYLDRSGE